MIPGDWRSELVQKLSRLAKKYGQEIRGATDSETGDLKSSLHGECPPELLSWLGVCAGMWLGLQVLCGTERKRGNMRIQDIMSRPEWPNSKLVPIAVDGFGNYYCLVADYPSPYHPIVFIEGAALDSIQYVASSSLGRFLDRFLDDVADEVEDWPFRKERELAADPELALIKGYVLPWDAD